MVLNIIYIYNAVSSLLLFWLSYEQQQQYILILTEEKVCDSQDENEHVKSEGEWIPPRSTSIQNMSDLSDAEDAYDATYLEFEDDDLIPN